MDSLVALSLTVEENEEWVLSSNRKDSGGFTESEHGDQINRGEQYSTELDYALPETVYPPSGLRRSFSRYLFGMVR